MITKRMKAHIEKLAHKSLKSSHVQKIRDALFKSKSQILYSKDLKKICGNITGAVYGALYRMALSGEIELYMKKYHMMSEQIIVKVPNKKVKPLYLARYEWRDSPGNAKQIQLVPPSPMPIKSGRSIEDMNVDELTKLINKAEKARLELMLKNRYDGADPLVKEGVCEVLRKYAVADPIALLHIDKNASFATYTATEQMPIIITIENGGRVNTLSCAHVTLHGTPLVKAIKESSNK